jgi:hypothetical protein
MPYQEVGGVLFLVLDSLKFKLHATVAPKIAEVKGNRVLLGYCFQAAFGRRHLKLRGSQQ